ncbi:MAG: Cof-type HAD-IIB family hydrolase [Candidatus Izimaplasma sp.]|nr:Cof-type HAD-IIB family hydrolase [Candidatus Izimaplasma bacterium]
MTIDLVISDMDGTLLTDDHTITDENLEAIALLKTKSIPFIIATGRPYQLVKAYINNYGLNTLFILNNGAEIYDAKTDKVLYEATLKDTVVEKILTYAKDNKLDRLIYTHDAIYSNDSARKRQFEQWNQVLDEKSKIIVKDIAAYPKGTPVNKLMLVEEDPVAYQTFKETIKTMGDFEVVSSKSTFIDINPKNVTKGNALKKWLKQSNDVPKNMLALGDQENDLSLLRVAHKKVAMKNAVQPLKDIADFITDSNNNSGVAKGIYHYFKK